jgi:hypothetical protein
MFSETHEVDQKVKPSVSAALRRYLMKYVFYEVSLIALFTVYACGVTLFFKFNIIGVAEKIWRPNQQPMATVQIWVLRQSCFWLLTSCEATWTRTNISDLLEDAFDPQGRHDHHL